MRAKAWLLGALAGAAALAGAGGASASDDCASIGAYAVCLFDEHEALTPSWGGHVWTRTNTAASLQGPGAGASVHQAERVAYVCNFPCWTLEERTTLATVQAPAARAEAGQRETRTGWSASSWGVWTAWTGARVEAQGLALAAGQHRAGSFGGGAGSCAWQAQAGAYSAPSLPCGAGPADTALPQLASTCWSTPAGPVCGTFPDWPDDTGLPFL